MNAYSDIKKVLLLTLIIHFSDGKQVIVAEYKQKKTEDIPERYLFIIIILVHNTSEGPYKNQTKVISELIL